MAVRKGSEEHRRQQQMHGWAFRNLTDEQVEQVRAYLRMETDEKPDLEQNPRDHKIAGNLIREQ